ncbi:hypothetical protein SDC9_182279 [bioreactor metagenome]|uniref:Uncharacterized protein n=1 Tax=bioreactor metagenome TaxID=1076179 RepID=A0A645H715_9ZZZZ
MREHLGFKREDHQHFRADLRQHRQPPLAPHPEVRADVPAHRNPAPVHHQREHQIEAGIVDQHHRAGPLRPRLPHQPEENSDKREDVPEHLHHADHAEFGRINPDVDSGGGHFRPPHARDGQLIAALGGKPPQIGGETRPVHVAGRFAGENPDRTFHFVIQLRFSCLNPSTACCAARRSIAASRSASSSGTKAISSVFRPNSRAVQTHA